MNEKVKGQGAYIILVGGKSGASNNASLYIETTDWLLNESSEDILLSVDHVVPIQILFFFLQSFGTLRINNV